MRFFHMVQNKKGFTLAEVLAVLAIVAFLASIVYMNGGEARKKARDTQRMNDMQQIALALRMYRDFNSTNPTGYDSGEVFGDGAGTIEGLIAPFLTDTIKDPQNTGNYVYVYDTDYTCNSTSHIVLYAKTMEQAGHGNWASVCGTTYTDGTSASTYGVIVK